MIRLKPDISNSWSIRPGSLDKALTDSHRMAWTGAMIRTAVRAYTSILCGILLILVASTSWAGARGVIQKVAVDDKLNAVTVESQGKLGKHLARVIARPNRLVIDFEDTKLGKCKPKIPVAKGNMREIRLGHFKGQARMVLDFGESPVPAFKIHRKGSSMRVAFDKPAQAGAASNPAQASEASAKGLPLAKSHLVPSAKPASALPQPEMKFPTLRLKKGKEQSSRKSRSERKAASHKKESKKAASKPMKLAQATGLKSMSPSRGIPSTVGRAPSRVANVNRSKGKSAGNAQGQVREVRPPVTPPTPDPRLLVQQITELKFIQVGHNSRLIIKGGDHLDYRMTKTSPTKLRIDLINAEIPKVHQKPLRTEQFSTSVEMIVPGSQTIFVQLKDAVTVQVQKKKGILMMDFPPPRFTLTQDQKSVLTSAGDQAARAEVEERRRAMLDRREAMRISKQQALERDIKNLDDRLNSLRKQREEIGKERREIENKYPPVSPDPKIFNKPISVDFQGMSLRNAFRLLAEQAGINIILGPDVSGTTTIKLTNVPLGLVIDNLLMTHNLARDMRGNVMWIAKAEKIEDARKSRTQDRETLISLVNKKMEDNEALRRQVETEKEKLRKELEKVEEIEETPTEVPGTVETVGATETIEIDGEPITLLLVQIRLSYRKPSKVIPILNCVFNNRCGRVTERTGATTQLEQRAAELSRIGFQPGSPGYESRMREFRNEQLRERRTQAMEQSVARQGAQLARALQGPGMDEKMQRILAHTVIWANDEFGMLFIKDLPERIEDMKKLVASLDVPTPQVLIEARVVQANRDWSRGMGVQWGGRNAQTGGVQPNKTAIWGFNGLEAGDATLNPTGVANAFPAGAGAAPTPRFVVNLPGTVAGFGTTTPLIGLGLQLGILANEYLGDLDARLQFGEATGQTKIIARPKVQVLDQQSANILQGRTIAFSTISAEGTQVQLVPVNLQLQVTPTIFPDGRIQMNVSITDNDVSDDIINGFSAIDNREARTVMIVKDGETAVIGGIVRKTKLSSRLGWPGLMNLPIINLLASNKTEEERVVELLVFITPSIVKRPPPAS